MKIAGQCWPQLSKFSVRLYFTTNPEKPRIEVVVESEFGYFESEISWNFLFYFKTPLRRGEVR